MIATAITSRDQVDADRQFPPRAHAVAEKAVFTHYGLTYRPGAGGERQLARR